MNGNVSRTLDKQETRGFPDVPAVLFAPSIVAQHVRRRDDNRPMIAAIARASDVLCVSNARVLMSMRWIPVVVVVVVEVREEAVVEVEEVVVAGVQEAVAVVGLYSS